MTSLRLFSVSNYSAPPVLREAHGRGRGWLDHCMRHHTGMETPLTACQHGATELREKPSQSLIQSSPRSEGKVCFNFAEVLKQTTDLDCALGKRNPGGNSPFSASTIRLGLDSPPPWGNAGTSMQFLKSKPADISSD